MQEKDLHPHAPRAYRQVTNGDNNVVFWGLRTGAETQVITRTMGPVVTGIDEHATFEGDGNLVAGDVGVLAAHTPQIQTLLEQDGWVQQPPVTIHFNEPQEV